MENFFLFLSAMLRGFFSVFSMGAPVVQFDEKRWIDRAMSDDWRYLGGDIIPALQAAADVSDREPPKPVLPPPPQENFMKSINNLEKRK